MQKSGNAGGENGSGAVWQIDHELVDMYAISGATGSTSGSNAYLLNVDQEYLTLIADWDCKMLALEAFNGQYFFNLPRVA